MTYSAGIVDEELVRLLESKRLLVPTEASIELLLGPHYFKARNPDELSRSDAGYSQYLFVRSERSKWSLPVHIQRQFHMQKCVRFPLLWRSLPMAVGIHGRREGLFLSDLCVMFACCLCMLPRITDSHTASEFPLRVSLLSEVDQLRMEDVRQVTRYGTMVEQLHASSQLAPISGTSVPTHSTYSSGAEVNASLASRRRPPGRSLMHIPEVISIPFPLEFFFLFFYSYICLLRKPSDHLGCCAAPCHTLPCSQSVDGSPATSRSPSPHSQSQSQSQMVCDDEHVTLLLCCTQCPVSLG